MGKSQVPKGSKKREKCKCGRMHFSTVQNKYLGCTNCFPVPKFKK